MHKLKLRTCRDGKPILCDKNGIMVDGQTNIIIDRAIHSEVLTVTIDGGAVDWQLKESAKKDDSV